MEAYTIWLATWFSLTAALVGHVPVDFNAPQVEDLRKFFDVMDSFRDKKVFVHCAANFRVSSFVARYGQARLGWPVDQANAHIKRLI